MAMATLQPVNHAYLLSIGRNAAAALLIQASLQSALLASLLRSFSDVMLQQQLSSRQLIM